MESELVRAWRKQKWSKRPYIFRGDHDTLSQSTHCFSSYRNFITHRDFPEQHKSLFHVGLIPVPFQGSLERADVFICLINPGFDLIDYYTEDLPSFRKVVLRNLKQKLSSETYPFFSLDPKWRWTGTGKWWNGLFGNIVREIAKKKSISYNDAAKLVSKRIAALEIVPYHSLNAAKVTTVSKKLESSKLIRDYLKRTVLPKAKKGNALVIIGSGLKMWEVKEKGKNIVHPPKKKGPKVALSMKSNCAGWKILQRLLKPKSANSLPARCARPGNK